MIWHKDYNLENKDNLMELPDEGAIFGIFAIVDDEPVNCRFIGKTENLRRTITDLFENPPSGGMRKFMQGPWIKILKHQPIGNMRPEVLQSVIEDWNREFKAAIDEEGEYPGYYE